MSVLSNIINVYTSPAKVFESVKDFNFKKALVPLLILAIVGVISFFFIQDLAAEFGIEKGREMIESRGGMTDEQKTEAIAAMEERSDSPIGGYISSFLGGPISALFMALIALIVGNTFMGGSAKFGQLVNVSAWAYMISILENIVKIPLMLSKWSFEVYTGLGVLGIGEKGTFINSIFNGIDIFAIWRIILIAIGMGIIYNKKTRPYAIAMLAVWLVLKIITAGVSSYLGGIFG